MPQCSVKGVLLSGPGFGPGFELCSTRESGHEHTCCLKTSCSHLSTDNHFNIQANFQSPAHVSKVLSKLFIAKLDSDGMAMKITCLSVTCDCSNDGLAKTHALNTACLCFVSPALLDDLPSCCPFQLSQKLPSLHLGESVPQPLSHG